MWGSKSIPFGEVQLGWVELLRPNGMKTTWTYDDASRLVSMTHVKSNGDNILSIAYEYDSAGNRTAITYTGAHPLSGRHVYAYDSLNRLIGADHPASATAYLPDEFYT